MKNEQWSAIYYVFEEIEQLCGNIEKTSSEVLTSEADGDMVKIRAHIRTQLDFLRAKLAETLAERDCYLILFAIVTYFDEYVQANYLKDSQSFWPPLQKEFFKIDNAGEVFYETLDDILRKPQTLPLIYEVFYFCLNHGFRGKYNDNPVKITEYLKKLRSKIQVYEPENLQTVPEEISQIKYVGSVAWHYVVAAGVIASAYFLLQAAANYWGLSFIF